MDICVPHWCPTKPRWLPVMVNITKYSLISNKVPLLCNLRNYGYFGFLATIFEINISAILSGAVQMVRMYQEAGLDNDILLGSEYESGILKIGLPKVQRYRKTSFDSWPSSISSSAENRGKAV